MQADIYQQKRQIFGGFSNTNILTAAAVTVDLPLPLARAGKRIFVQRLRVLVQVGNAGKTVTFASSTGAPATVLCGLLALDTTGTAFSFDYGPEGLPMTVAEAVKATISATGAAFAVHLEGYFKA